MISARPHPAALLGIGLLGIAALRFAPTKAQGPATSRTRFNFQVVESFDAKYLGDTPGHVGRAGNLGGKPNVALGDPVFRGDRRVGRISGLTWDRSRDSLVIEFDPEVFEFDANQQPTGRNRVFVGDEVWISLTGESTPRPAR